MERIFHYNTIFDTFGGILEDGTKAVCIAITDEEENRVDCHILHPDVAKDLGNELIKVVKELMT